MDRTKTNASARAAVRRRGPLVGAATCLSTVCVLTLGATADDARVVSGDANEPSIARFEDLVAHVEKLAGQPYRPSPPMPAALAEMDYDAYRHILFRNERALWYPGGKPTSPYWIEAFHKGFVQRDDVKLNVLDGGRSWPVRFTKDDFHYWGEAGELELPDDLGIAGLKFVGTFPGHEDGQEILTFLGSSYFRARAARHVYGASTRGLAVDIGMNADEEFPVFREFWVSRPQLGERELKLLALLDGPSVVGAYEFTMNPGDEETTVDVRAEVRFRRQPGKVGVAPLTSMWMWGDGLDGPEGDHRPEVHDSDGLLIAEPDGGWMWRALCRQAYPSVVRYPYDETVRGFGLIQRDRDPEHYQDDEARYAYRPSLWITPENDWGAGAIELIELDAKHEGVDNVVAYWVPNELPTDGEPLRLEYRVSFAENGSAEHDLGRAVATRVDRMSHLLQIDVEFEGVELAENEEPVVDVRPIRGEVRKARCIRGEDGHVTARLEIEPTSTNPVELTVVLNVDGEPRTETWKYLCPVKPPAVSLPPWRLKELE